MATCTIVVTTNSNGSVGVASTDAPSFKYVTGTDARGQASAVAEVIKGLIASVLALPN